MAMINCPECGKEVSDQAKVCPNCGIKIAKSKSKPIIIGILAIVAVVIVGLVFVFTLKKGDVVNTVEEIYTDEPEEIIETEGLLFQRSYYDQVEQGFDILRSHVKNPSKLKINEVTVFLGYTTDYKYPCVNVSYISTNSYGAEMDSFCKILLDPKYALIPFESKDYNWFEGAIRQATGKSTSGEQYEILEGVWSNSPTDEGRVNKVFYLNLDDFNQIMGTNY